MSYPNPFPFYVLSPDAVLVFIRRLFVCDLVLLFNCDFVSETFVYECLEFSGCYLG